MNHSLSDYNGTNYFTRRMRRLDTNRPTLCGHVLSGLNSRLLTMTDHYLAQTSPNCSELRKLNFHRYSAGREGCGERLNKEQLITGGQDVPL